MANISQLINLSTGSPSDINHLVLLWLAPEATPPPPGPEDPPPESIPIGVPATILSDATVIPTTGATFALPAGGTRLSWQTIFSVNPISILIKLQISLDGVKWSTTDESDNINGELRTVKVNSKFVRAILTDDDIPDPEGEVNATVRILVRREKM